MNGTLDWLSRCCHSSFQFKQGDRREPGTTNHELLWSSCYLDILSSQARWVLVRRTPTCTCQNVENRRGLCSCSDLLDSFGNPRDFVLVIASMGQDSCLLSCSLFSGTQATTSKKRVFSRLLSLPGRWPFTLDGLPVAVQVIQNEVGAADRLAFG